METTWSQVVPGGLGINSTVRQDLRVCIQDRPGLVVLMIELENALGQMATNAEPTKMWSPYRQPLGKFLNRYTPEVRAPSGSPEHPLCSSFSEFYTRPRLTTLGGVRVELCMHALMPW